MKKNETTQEFEGHPEPGGNGPVCSTIYFQDGEKIISAGSNTLRIWEMGKKSPDQILKGHLGISGSYFYWVVSLSLSPDETLAVSGGEDSTARLWDLKTGACLHVWKEHKDRVLSVAFSPDGKKIVTGGRDKTLRIFDVATRREIESILCKNPIACVAFANNENVFVSGDFSATVELWNIKEKSLSHSFDPYTKEERSVFPKNFIITTEFVFSLEHNLLAVGKYDGSIALWR